MCGVRVELPAKVFEHITDVVYESKLVYRTKQYGDQVRTFCMNPYGHVVAENVEGINTVNGHSYSDPKLRSENTNFALLVSNRFTSPFNEPYRYGKHIASLSNMLAGGVLVQRFGALVKGVRTNEHRLGKSFTRPTLTAAVPGDPGGEDAAWCGHLPLSIEEEGPPAGWPSGRRPGRIRQ